jgi:TolB-like protein/class 3 adenylate cyclase
LSTRINAARSLIGDSGEEQRLIRTAHGKGFRFTGSVREQEETVRKLAAIFAADVEGYSRLMERDEVGTLHRLTACRAVLDKLIAAHHGRVFGSAGDSVIADFSSAVDAVQCAVAVQEAMAIGGAAPPPAEQMRFRIGVHVGDVLVQGENLFGDGVNIAARLEALAEPGGICISAAVRDQIGTKLSVGFTDLGEQQVKNIARPVRAYHVVLDRRPTPAGATSLPPTAPRLSLVVLPFANLSNDPEQDYFVDGVTESLTTDLSRVSGSFVIARNTAFTYKGKPFDVRKIGHELNVRYVLEGSVQRGGNRMRVNVQLIDTESGIHLWAERFDKALADLFDMQDEIVARLARTLNTQLIEAEARRAERTPGPDSMDLTFQGLACLNKGENPADLAQARSFFQRALTLDPRNLDALLGAPHIDYLLVSGYMADDPAGTLAAVEATVIKALALAPNNAWAHHIMGRVYVATNRMAQGIAEHERALALDPNYASAHASIGYAKFVNGHAEETEAHILEALRFSPRDTYSYKWVGFRAVAKLFLGAHEEAVAWYRRSIEINPNYLISHIYLAAALAELGRLDDARAAARVGLAIDPKFTLQRFRAGAATDNPVFLQRREQIIEGLRRAGIPED